MKVLAWVLYFALLWLRGVVVLVLWLTGALATVTLFVLAIEGIVLPKNPVHLYLRESPHHHAQSHYWALVIAAFCVAFGSFMLRYFYNWLLMRLNLVRLAAGTQRPAPQYQGNPQ